MRLTAVWSISIVIYWRAVVGRQISKWRLVSISISIPKRENYCNNSLSALRNGSVASSVFFLWFEQMNQFFYASHTCTFLFVLKTISQRHIVSVQMAIKGDSYARNFFSRPAVHSKEKKKRNKLNAIVELYLFYYFSHHQYWRLRVRLVRAWPTFFPRLSLSLSLSPPPVSCLGFRSTRTPTYLDIFSDRTYSKLFWISFWLSQCVKYEVRISSVRSTWTCEMDRNHWLSTYRKLHATLTEGDVIRSSLITLIHISSRLWHSLPSIYTHKLCTILMLSYFSYALTIPVLQCPASICFCCALFCRSSSSLISIT